MRVLSNHPSDHIKTVRKNEAVSKTDDRGKQSANIAETKQFRGEIVDLKQNEATIKLESGEKITARLVNPEEAQIGEAETFEVKKDEKGKPLLEIIKDDKAKSPEEKMMSNALKAAGLKATPQNLKMVEELLKNQLPIDKATLQKLNQAVKLVNTENPLKEEKALEKAIFILKNEIKPTLKNIRDLEKIVNNENKMKEQIDHLSNSIENIKEDKTKQLILNALEKNNYAATTKTMENVAKALTENIAPTKETEVLTKFIENQLKADPQTAEKLKQLQQTVKGASPEKVEQEVKNFIATLTAQVSDKIKTDSKFEHILKAPLENPEKNSLVPSKIDALLQKISTTEQAPKIIQEDIAPMKNEIAKLPDPKAIINEFSEKIKLNGESKKEIVQFLKDFLEEKPALSPHEPDKIKQKMHFTLSEKGSPKQVEDFVNDLNEKLKEVHTIASKSETEEMKQITKETTQIRENLNFNNQLKDFTYVQLPLVIHNHESQAELFVFKDKDTKNKKKETKSALISLDLAALGHFETYVQKKGNQVYLQFRVEDQNVESVVKSNLTTLNTLLSKHNYHLEGYQFKNMEEKFTVIDEEPTFDENDIEEMDKKRFTFDIRT